MKTLLVFLFSFVFLAFVFGQETPPKYGDNSNVETVKTVSKQTSKNRFIQIGANPVQWNRTLLPGEVALKISKELFVKTQSKGGKWVKGYVPKGTIIIVNEKEFSAGECKEFLIATCGNPTVVGSKGKSLASLDLTTCIPFAYNHGGEQIQISTGKSVDFVDVPNDQWFKNFESKLFDRLDSLDERIMSLEDMISSMGIPVVRSTFWNSAWPYVIGGLAIAAGTIIAVVSLDNDHGNTTINYNNGNNGNEGGPPPDPPNGRSMKLKFLIPLF